MPNRGTFVYNVHTFICVLLHTRYKYHLLVTTEYESFTSMYSYVSTAVFVVLRSSECVVGLLRMLYRRILVAV